MATTPRIADIGAVPDGLGEDLTRFLQQVQRLLRTGVQTGGISGSGSGSSGSGGGTTIIGGGAGGGGISGMDDPTPPPTPSGVTVEAGLSYVFFETAAPVFTMGAGYDRTRVYIAQYPASAPTPPTFGDAVLAYEFVGQIGAMPATSATRLCVWLKWRTKAGYDSTTPAGGINGFIVETGQDVELLLKALTGSITASELHAALGARIDLIDGPSSMAGSVAARVLAEAEARGAAITAEQTARQTADTSLANSITTLTASVSNNASAITTEQTARVNADSAIASSISTLQSRVDFGDAAPFDPYQSWEFGGSVDGWTASGASLSLSSYGIQLTASTADQSLFSPGITIAGAEHNKVRARLKRVDGVAWQGTLYYSTAGHGYSESYKKTIAEPDWPGWRIIEWDMEDLTAGGADWLESTITGIRLDLGNSASDAFDIDWISVGKRSVGISRVAVNAAIQVEATTRATVDGHVASLYTVRTSLTSGGRTVIGGFGLSGTSSATAGAAIDFGVRADRFWIGPPDDGSAPGVGDILPFVVQAAPVTINDVVIPKGVYMDAAYIVNLTAMVARLGNAWIDSAMIANLSAAKIIAGSLAVGQYIQSSNYTPSTQGWRINADGSAQFMAASIAGQLTAGQIDTRGLSIKDSSGNIILAAGNALSSDYAAPGTRNSDAGANVVYNDDLGQGPLATFSNALGATFGTNLSDAWRLAPAGGVGTNVGWCFQAGRLVDSTAYAEVATEPFPVEGNTRMLGAAYTGAHSCTVYLFAYYFNASGLVGNSYSTAAAATNAAEALGGPSLDGYKRLVTIMDVPAGATYAKLILRKMDTNPGATESWMFYARISCAKVGATDTAPAPWSPSGLANPTNVSAGNPITPANVSTYIASVAIGSSQIADLSVGDTKVGNFIKSYNFNGAIDSAGNITNVGTVGWALGRAGVMVVDAAHIRGRLTASQVNVSQLTAITANLGSVTAGTLSNASGSTFIDMNAAGSQIMLRSGAFDFATGRFPVQIMADGEALFTKQVASGIWNGSSLYFQRTTVGANPTITAGVVVIDTGYNYPYGQSINRDFVARVSYFTTHETSSVGPGQYSHAVQLKAECVRGISLFNNGAPQNQSANIFGAYNDRIYIIVNISVINDAVLPYVMTRSVTSISWNLLLGV